MLCLTYTEYFASSCLVELAFYINLTNHETMTVYNFRADSDHEFAEPKTGTVPESIVDALVSVLIWCSER